MKKISVCYVSKQAGRRGQENPSREFETVDQLLSEIALYRMGPLNDSHYMQIFTPTDISRLDLDRLLGAGVISSGAFLPRLHGRAAVR
jgi:hypothetical protein